MQNNMSMLLLLLLLLLLLPLEGQLRSSQHNSCSAEEGESENGQQMREPLLVGLDGDEGSVGSEDTTNCSLSEFGDYEERPPEERREPLGGGSYVDPPQVSKLRAVLANVEAHKLFWNARLQPVHDYVQPGALMLPYQQTQPSTSRWLLCLGKQAKGPQRAPLERNCKPADSPVCTQEEGGDAQLPSSAPGIPLAALHLRLDSRSHPSQPADEDEDADHDDDVEDLGATLEQIQAAAAARAAARAAAASAPAPDEPVARSQTPEVVSTLVL